MSLGDFFPDNLKNDFAKRNIDLGNTLLIKVPDFTITYDKYIVVVAKDDHEISIAYVVINSEVNLNVAYNSYLKSLHLKIDKKNHPFLKKDSFVNCSRLREFPNQTVVNFLIKKPRKSCWKCQFKCP
jgi:hypothetical protein|tara:strand:- start:413 stop:793 length:381 start_codon:yes stop_codon:yes gene_type:complete